jgi:CubicO group peptidase (beta-lactamase class C family)
MANASFLARATAVITLLLGPPLGPSPLEAQRAATAARPRSTGDAATARVDALFARWNRAGSPGCSVGISRNGTPIYEKGFGTASIELGVPITPASVLHVASVSKQFTAASILLLAKAGKLSIDDEVRRYVPEWQGPSVTIRQLLTHTAGLRDAFLLIELAALDGSTSMSDRLVALLARQRGLNAPPGSEYAYNNGGYDLLAEIDKRVSGRSLRAFTDAELFEPLGMRHTHVHDDQSVIVPNLATGYIRRGDDWRLARAPGGVVGTAGLMTTTDDLLRWADNLRTGRVGGAALVAAMQQPTTLTTGQISDYGFGLQVGRHRGLRTISHSGGDQGASAYLVRYPDQGLAIAVLCNTDEINSTALAEQIAEIHLGGAMTVQPTAAHAPAPARIETSQLSAYEGLYRDANNEALLRIFVRDGTLRGSAGADIDEGWPTTPVGPDRFTIPGTGITLAFAPSGEGGQTLRVSGEREAPSLLQRLMPFTPAPDSLPAFAGDYVCDELDTTYAIASTAVGLTVRIPGRAPIALKAIDPGGFAGPLVGVLRFTRDAGGQVSGFTLNASAARGVRCVRAASSRPR